MFRPTRVPNRIPCQPPSNLWIIPPRATKDQAIGAGVVTHLTAISEWIWVCACAGRGNAVSGVVVGVDDEASYVSMPTRFTLGTQPEAMSESWTKDYE